MAASPQDCKAAVLDVIRGAKRDLSLSLFRCNDPDVFDELRRARDRGVAVEALITARAGGAVSKLEKLRRRLAEAGASISTYADPVVKYHAKYLVADEGPAIVASLNFTKKCFSKTIDAVVVTYDPAVVQGLRDLMAADKQMHRAPSGLPSRLVVGPERARTQLTDMLRAAKSSIRLLDAKLSDPAFVALLGERKSAGIDVELLDSKRYGERKSHGKVCLIDDRVAVVGGLALAALSLDFRREVALVVDAPEAVAELRKLLDGVSSMSADARASA